MLYITPPKESIMLNYGLTDLEERFSNAVRESTAAGVPVRWNEEAICCRSCYVVDNPAEVYTLSQFGRITFRGDGAYYVETVEVDCTCTEDEYGDDDNVIAEGERCEVCTGEHCGEEELAERINSVYFYFGGVRSAEVFTAALENNGIPVAWDGTPHTAVEVRFNG